MTVIDLEERQGAWFDMDGGGRVQIRTLTAEDMRLIKQKTVKKRTEFKKVDGTPGRFEFEEVNEELQNEMFWDRVIVAWEGLYDGKGNEIPCTKENKVLLMLKSAMFAKFIADSIKQLGDSEAEMAELSEKN